VREFPNRGESVLIIKDLIGSEERKVASHSLSKHFERIAWPPNGKTIACVARTSANGSFMQLISVPAAGGSERPLGSKLSVGLGHIAWTSDGKGLVFAARDEVSNIYSKLWYLSYPEGRLRRITNDLNNYVSISAAAQRDSLVTVSFIRDINIWMAEKPDLSQARQLTVGNGRYIGISWTPDQRLVYASDASGNFDIWIMKADGSGSKQMTFDNSSDWYPTVSPDGRYVVFASDRTGRFQIWRMDINGDNLGPLTKGKSGVRLSCSPDGKWIVFSSGTEQGALWKVSIDGGEAEQITADGFLRPVISPDGKFIACNYRDEQSAKWRVAVIPFAGGAPVKVFDFPLTSDGLPPVRWTSDGRALTYIETVNGISNLWSQPLDGSKPVQLTRLKEYGIYNFDWSPDGKQLALTRGDVTKDVILISNFR
jgi:Tol biopolymer transport system component